MIFTAFNQYVLYQYYSCMIRLAKNRYNSGIIMRKEGILTLLLKKLLQNNSEISLRKLSPFYMRVRVNHVSASVWSEWPGTDALVI